MSSLLLIPSGRRWIVGLALGLLPFIAIVAGRWTMPPSASSGDFAQYLMHAKALSEGRPYSDIGYIYSRYNAQVGPRNQPPGWPVVLTPFVAAFGTDFRVYRVLQAVLVGVLAGLSGWYFARRDAPWIGVAVASVVAVALEAARATESAISDPFFCVLVWSALLVADRPGPLTLRRGAVVAALVMASVSVRVAGIALVPALVLWAAVAPRTDRRAAWATASLPVVCAAIAVVLFASDVPFLERALGSPAELADRALDGIGAYRGGILSGTLYPFPWDRMNDVYHVVIIPPLAAGAFLLARDFRGSLLWCLIPVYVLMLVLSPVREGRYIWVLYPVLAYALFAGARWLAIRLAPRHAGGVATAGLVLALALSTGSALRIAAQPPPPSLIGDPVTQELFDWLRREHAVRPMRVSFTNPRVLTMMTGVPAMAGLPRTAEIIMRELEDRRITHVITLRVASRLRADSAMHELTESRRQDFQEVFANEKYQVHAVRVDQSRATRDSTASISGSVRGRL